MAHLRKPFVILIFALAAVIAVEGAALAAAVGRNGKSVTAVRTVVSEALWSTESGNWIDVPDMKTFVSVPKDQKAILIVTFSTTAVCNPGETTPAACLVRVLLDGQEVSPGVAQWGAGFAGVNSGAGVRSMQWVAGPVPQGDHQVKVQASTGGTGAIGLYHMTLTVLRSRF